MTKTQQIIAGLVGSYEKTAMHGSADYQMTEPVTPPIPQMPLEFYGGSLGHFAGNPDETIEPEPAQRQQGLLDRGVPWKPMMAGATAGGFGGKALMDPELTKELQQIRFLKGEAGERSPVITDKLLKMVAEGKLKPKMVAEAQKTLASPEGVKAFFKSPAEWEAALQRHKGEYWKAMGKGPGLGMLGGAALGLGGGLLYNQLSKESSLRELIEKSAFRAPAPSPDLIPDAWREFREKRPFTPSYGHTMSAQAPIAVEHTVARSPLARPGGAKMRGLIGVMSKGRLR